MFRRKLSSRRRIKKRFLQGKWIDKYDIVRHRLGDWLRSYAFEEHDKRQACRFLRNRLPPPFIGNRVIQGRIWE